MSDNNNNVFFWRKGLVVFSFLIFSFTHAQDFSWGHKLGGAGYDYSYGVAADAFGNVYTGGSFSDTADLDPGTGVLQFTAPPNVWNPFIVKLNANGDLSWAAQFAGFADGEIYSVTTDPYGNCFATGVFSGTMDFDPGVTTYNLSATLTDMFVVKLDSSGVFKWAIQIAGSGNSKGNRLIADNNGNVFVTGYFSMTADLDPGPGINNVTSAGNDDAIIMKLDSTGLLKWLKVVGGGGQDRGFALTLDINGNIISTGRFSSTADLDPGAGVSNFTSNGGHDIFVLKLDSAGNFIWAKTAGSTGNDFGNVVISTSNGNIYTTGAFTGSVDFDPGTSTHYLPFAGNFDMFLQILDSSGNFVSAFAFGSSGGELPSAIVADSSDNIYLTGSFQNTVDFDPGTGVFNLTSSINSNLFIVKLTASGNFVWAKQTTGIFSVAQSMALNPAGEIFVSGYFDSSADIDPGSSTSTLVSNGWTDAFIIKLSSPVPVNEVISDDRVLIFPNPSDDELYISVADYSGDYQLKVCDVNGKIIKLEQSVLQKNETLQLNLKEMPRGIYEVILIMNHGILTRKIIRQ